MMLAAALLIGALAFSIPLWNSGRFWRFIARTLSAAAGVLALRLMRPDLDILSLTGFLHAILVLSTISVLFAAYLNRVGSKEA